MAIQMHLQGLYNPWGVGYVVPEYDGPGKDFSINPW
jgi:hypothetical protein